MADQKISQLAELPNLPAVDDEFVVVDISDTTMGASGTNKRVKRQNLVIGAVATSIRPGEVVSAPASSATGVTNTWYAVQLVVLSQSTLAGIRYRVGATSNGNVRAALFDSAGATKVADRTTDAAQGTANAIQAVTFDSTYLASPGIYYAVLWFSSATATWFGARLTALVATGTNAGGTPSSVSAAVANADRPLLNTF